MMILLLGTCVSAQRVPAVESSAITVVDKAAGCMLPDTPVEVLRKQDLHYSWERVADGYRLRERLVSDEQIASLRALLLDRGRTPPDLLAALGIDAAAITRHRVESLRTALELDRQTALHRTLPKLEPELERYVTYEYLAPLILSELRGENWLSTEHRTFEVVLPGEPTIKVSSHGLVPWMLPWTVTVGAESWKAADLALSRALLPLADPDGNCADLLDGTDYWSSDFWRDEHFWGRFVGDPIRAAQNLEKIARLDGYASFSERFQLEKVGRGSDYSRFEAFCTFVAAKLPAVIDKAVWAHDLERAGQPAATWNDFLALYDGAARAATRQRWLEEWKRGGSERSVTLEGAGKEGTQESALEDLVVPAWRDAGFTGAPQYQLHLSRNDRWCGTVYLSDTESKTLIETARPGEGTHWFDALDFSFHPRSQPPTYGRVDADGKFELRQIVR